MTHTVSVRRNNTLYLHTMKTTYVQPASSYSNSVGSNLIGNVSHSQVNGKTRCVCVCVCVCACVCGWVCRCGCMYMCHCACVCMYNCVIAHYGTHQLTSLSVMVWKSKVSLLSFASRENLIVTAPSTGSPNTYLHSRGRKVCGWGSRMGRDVEG